MPNLRKALHVMGNLMDTVFKAIDEACDLDVIRYGQTIDSYDNFYLFEQSSIQVLRELPSATFIQVTELTSQRHRIVQKIESIKLCRTVEELLQMVMPLVEDGNFPADKFVFATGDNIEVRSYYDMDIHLTCADTAIIQDLVHKILLTQRYESSILGQIIQRPKLYHKLERPGKISGSYLTFEEAIEIL
jgi:hypothetical protein